MKNIFNYLPGFRTDKNPKKIIATVYYIVCLLMLVNGIGAFLIMTSIPFIVFSIVDIIKLRDKTVVFTLFLAIIVCGIGGNLDNSVSINKIVSGTNVTSSSANKVEADKEATVAEVKAEADKAIAVAQAKAEADKAVVVAQAKAEADKAVEVAQAKAIADQSVATAQAKVQADQAAEVQANVQVDQAASQNINQTVYITKTGKKYHSAGCRYLSKSEIAIKKSVAVDEGYTACSVCNP